MIVAAEFLAITHFASFTIGFGIGFFYLKHKFESHVAGVFDFESGEAAGLDEVLADLDISGDKK